MQERLFGWTEPITRLVSRASESHRIQLVVTAAVSGGVVAGSIFAFQASTRRRRLRRLKLSIDPNIEDHDIVADLITKYKDHNLDETSSTNGQIAGTQELSPEDARGVVLAGRARKGDYDEELILEQLARNRVFLTSEGLEKVRNSFVIILGLGGVGSHAAAALARSGISKIRLIDFDQVTLSSLNRHAVATLADVGTPKVDCMRRRLEQITPWVQFDCRNELFRLSVADSQLEQWHDPDTSEPGLAQKPDFVIDAIDNIDSKVELLQYCHDNHVPVISSMGAGCKSDPTRVFIGDIADSIEDPLSRSVRRRLKILGVSTGVPVVFSTEKAEPGKAQLQPLPEEQFQKGKVGELGVLPDFRVRILPVLGTMPAVFGLCVANYVMLELTGYPHEFLQSKGRDKMYEGILAQLQGMEERLAKWAGEDVIGLRIPINQGDVGYLIEEVFRGRSVVSGLPTRLTLVRWDKPSSSKGWINKDYEGQKFSSLALEDLVCMTKEEAAKHEREVLKGSKAPTDLYREPVLTLVSKRKEEERYFEHFR